MKVSGITSRWFTSSKPSLTISFQFKASDVHGITTESILQRVSGNNLAISIDFTFNGGQMLKVVSIQGINQSINIQTDGNNI